MKKSVQLLKSLANQHGSIIIFIALGLVMLLGFAALAVDIGHITATKNELQNIGDAASLAATRKLGDIYRGKTYEEQQNYVCDPADIIPVAKDVGSKNQAGKKNITINDADVIIGQWKKDLVTNKWYLEPTLDQPDAVKVIARRSSSSAEGPLSNIFAKIIGKDTTNVEADAVAALTPQSTVEPGNLIPVGIAEEWFKNQEVFCDQVIKFYPTNTPEGCAGWNTFFHWPASESYLRKDILEEWLNNPANPPAPGAAIGDEIVFTGGTLGNQTFTAFFNLWDYMRKNDGDGNDSQWTAQVVVYKSDSCSNPNGRIEIAGFATAVITNVIPPNVEITAKVICKNVEPGRGGGGEYGTKGDIPGLVE